MKRLYDTSRFALYDLAHLRPIINDLSRQHSLAPMILGSVKYALQWIADALLFVNNSLGLAGGRLPKADRNRYASCAALYWLGNRHGGLSPRALQLNWNQLLDRYVQSLLASIARLAQQPSKLVIVANQLTLLSVYPRFPQAHFR